MTVTFDTSVLLGYYQARTGLAGLAAAGAGGVSGAGGAKKYAPTAPWATTSAFPRADALAKSVILGRRFIDENAAKLDLKGASTDYKKLFALYQGLNALEGVAEKANGKSVSNFELGRLDSTFQRGLAEVSGYLDTLKLDQIRLTKGDTALSAKTEVGVPKAAYEYTTKTLFTGSVSDEAPAFQGAAAFDLTVVRQGVTHNISVDLSELGSQPRTISNVVSLINGKLEAEGLYSRFAVERTKAEDRVIEAGGKKITLPAIGDAFALKIKGDSIEQLTFSATSRPSVYVSTLSGDPDPDKDVKTNDGVLVNTLTKIDPAAGIGPDSRISTADFEGTVKTVRKSLVGADGSLYVLADVEKSVDGQAIQGQQDVALLKYDSAGHLTYARTLGAADTASGLALAVSSDGHIAVAGSVTGGLEGATNGPINSTTASGKSDSFVTLYDTAGDEVWTERRGSLQDDEATAVAFDDKGNVYVGGRTKSALPGGSANGGWDGYVTAYSTTDTGAPKALFTQQFGTTGDDGVSGLVVDNGKVVVAGDENGSAVLRSFDVTLTETRITKTWSGGVLTVTNETYTGGSLTDSQSQQYQTPGATDATTTSSYYSGATATAGATRNLGALQGGSIAGLKLDGGELYIAGDTRNGALSVSNTTRAYDAGKDGFIAKLSTDLSSSASDTLAYYGGAGDNTVAGFDVASGEVYLVGSAGTDLPGLTNLGAKNGYLAQVNLAAGTITATQQLTGKDGITTATGVAVDASGASDLDKFGLPRGTIEFNRSQYIVAATSARAGDQFQIRTRAGGYATTITIEAKDTLDTLAAKIRRAAGYNAKVEVQSAGNAHVLKISPRNDNGTIEILAGKGGKNALDALGLAEGVVRNTKIVDGKSVSAAPGGNIYGLGLDLNLNLLTEDARKSATTAISAALAKIRTAYRDLEAAAKPKTATTAQTGGKVPAYLQAQIANYQAGLNRLTGGG